jgi:hypothetical protein
MLRAKYAVALAPLVLLPALNANAASEKDKDIAEIGDWVQILLPVSGYVGAWITGDKEGAYQLTKVLGAAGISAQIFKAAAARGRPDAKDDRSFPSGHTTAAFAGSEFIRIRYGNGWGIPAHIAAAFVAYSRIRANKHFRDDVLAGASNGLLWNWFFTSPYDEALNIRPVVHEDGYSIEIAYDFDNKSRSRHAYSDKPRWDFTLEFGPVSQDKNLFASPPDTGFEIDLATAENEFDVTSRVTVQHFFRDRHEWEGYLAPMELIEFDPAQVLTGPADFGGVTFVPLPGTQFEGRYNLLEVRFVYRYELLRSEKWSVKVGGGLQYIDTFLGITQFMGLPSEDMIVQAAEAQSEDIAGVFSARVEFDFNDRWSARYEFDGAGGSDTYYNNGLSLNWKAAVGWELGLGARSIQRDFRNNKLRNELEVGDFVLRVTHGFF